MKMNSARITLAITLILTMGIALTQADDKPVTFPAALKTVTTLYNQRKYPQAIDAAQAAMKVAAKESQKALCHLYLGYSLMNTHKNKEAIEHYAKVIENKKANPKHQSSAMLYSAICEQRLKHLDKAYAMLETLLKQPKLTPHIKATALYHRSIFQRMEKKYDLALKTTEEALATKKLNPNLKYSIQIQQGEIYRIQKKYDLATQAYQKVINGEKSPAYLQSQALYLMGVSQINHRAYKLAIKTFSRLKENATKYQPYYVGWGIYYMGNCFLNLKQKEQAIQAWQEVITRPKSPKGAINAAKKQLKRYAEKK